MTTSTRTTLLSGGASKAKQITLTKANLMNRVTVLFLFAATVLMLSLLTATGAHAEGYAGQAGAFLRMGAGAASVGGGDAGVARATGLEQAYYNPAGLPYSPSNEVHAGYHILSLDRQLYHVGFMYQVPRLTFWSDPIVPYEIVPADEEHTYPRLLKPGSSLRRRARAFKPDDYLEALETTILQVAETGTPAEYILLVIKDTPYSAPELEELIVEMAKEVADKGITTTTGVKDLLRQKYTTERLKPAAVALTWTHAGVTDIEGRGFDGREYGTLSFHENRFALSFGLKLHPKVSIGTTVGILYALIPDMLEEESKALTSTNTGVDIGIQVRPFNGNEVPYRLETLTFGLAAYDLGGKYTWNTTGYWSQGTTKDDKFPKRYRAGMNYQPVQGLAVYVDLETDLDDLLRAKGGFEYALFGSVPEGGSSMMSYGSVRPHGFVLRAGVDRDRPTFGFGLDVKLKSLGVTRIDYAYVVEPVSPDPTQVISWRFRF